MTIEKINIINFGKLSNMSLDLADGINIIEGKNESGKSTICSFIKFMFYGLSPVAEERARQISWNSGNAAGSMTVREDTRVYRIEREVVSSQNAEGKISYRERAVVYDGETGKQAFRGVAPGEEFFGIPRAVFESTAFIGQLDGAQVGGRPLAEAAENILFSADESVNTKKALKKLDEARVYLYHKNKRGGKIYEYTKERTILAESLDEAQRASAQIINLEGSARALTDARQATKKELDKSEEKIASYERYRIKINYARYLEEKKKREVAADKLHDMMTHDRYKESNMTDEQFISLMEKEKYELAALESDFNNASASLENISSKLAKMNLKLVRFQELCDKDERHKLVSTAKNAHESKGKAKKLSVIFAVAALIALAAVFVPYLAVRIIGALTAIGTVALAAVMFIRSKQNERAETAIYKRFGCKAFEEFSELLEAAKNERATVSFIEDSKAEALQKKEQAEERFEAKKARIFGLLSKAEFNVSGNIANDIDEAIKTARKSFEILRGTAQEKKNAEAKMNDIAAVLSSFSDEEKERALRENFNEEEMSAFDLAAQKHERDELAALVGSQTEKLHAIECELASLSTVKARPAEIAQSISALDGKIDHLTEKFDAYMLAIESIEAASGKLRDAVSPQIAKTAGKIMSGLSGGKYRTIFMDSEFSMSYSDSGITRKASSLSAGTSDIAYISLRLALIETLCKRMMPPLVFDESFTRLDDERLAAALSLIEDSYSKKAQVLIFTCHGREKSVSENSISSTILSI